VANWTAKQITSHCSCIAFSVNLMTYSGQPQIWEAIVTAGNTTPTGPKSSKRNSDHLCSVTPHMTCHLTWSYSGPSGLVVRSGKLHVSVNLRTYDMHNTGYCMLSPDLRAQINQCRSTVARLEEWSQRSLYLKSMRIEKRGGTFVQPCSLRHHA